MVALSVLLALVGCGSSVSWELLAVVDQDGDGKAYIDGDCDDWPGHDGHPLIVGQNIYASIQAAVDAAKDGDIITICPLPSEQEYGGLTVIEDKSISIVGGDDPDRIVLNGEDAGTTIRVADGSLTLKNLTITGGTGTRYNASGGQEVLGGGVDAAFATGLTIENCIIQGNSAQYGGGVFAPVLEGAETLILDSQLSDNVAYWGGGAYIQWGGQIIGTGIYRNASDLAGGVFSGANTLTVTASVISENTSRETISGGGALIYDGKLNSEDSDWGQGDTNNTRNDIMLANTRTDKTKSYNDKTSGETFSCDASVPSCS